MPESGPKSGVTRVQVEPGSRQHNVLVEENAEPLPEERRKAPAPVNVSVGPSGGLTGWAATIANLSAVAFVMIMMFFIYQDFKGNVKENQQLVREQQRSDREQSEKNNQAIVNAMTQQTATLNSVMHSMQAKFDAMALTNQALVNEMKSEQQTHNGKIDELIRTIKAKQP